MSSNVASASGSFLFCPLLRLLVRAHELVCKLMVAFSRALSMINEWNITETLQWNFSDITVNSIKCGRSVSVCVCVLMCMIYLAPAKAMDAPPTLQLEFWDICLDCVVRVHELVCKLMVAFSRAHSMINFHWHVSDILVNHIERACVYVWYEWFTLHSRHLWVK